MTKPIAIIAGEPNSISSEIIFKSWMLRKKYSHKPILIIGSYQILNLQRKKLKYKIKIKNINYNFKKRDLNGKALPVINVDYKQKKAFEKISTRSNNYIFKCFQKAMNLSKRKIDKLKTLEEVKNQLVNAEKTKILNMHSLSHYDKLKRSVTINYIK